jgi:hypothetical protein
VTADNYCPAFCSTDYLWIADYIARSFEPLHLLMHPARGIADQG